MKNVVSASTPQSMYLEEGHLLPCPFRELELTIMLNTHDHVEQSHLIEHIESAYAEHIVLISWSRWSRRAKHYFLLRNLNGAVLAAACSQFLCRFFLDGYS